MAPLHHSSSWQIVRCLQWLICHVNLLTLLRLLLVCLANATGFGSCNILFKIAKKKSLELLEFLPIALIGWLLGFTLADIRLLLVELIKTVAGAPVGLLRPWFWPNGPAADNRKLFIDGYISGGCAEGGGCGAVCRNTLKQNTIYIPLSLASTLNKRTDWVL